MKNKGFTLIELIAVLVIMSIITLLATPNVISLMNKGKEDSMKSQIKTYVTECVTKYKESDSSGSSSCPISSTDSYEQTDSYGYVFTSNSIVNISETVASDDDTNPTPSERTITLSIKSCKNESKCHCLNGTIKQIEEIEKLELQSC